MEASYACRGLRAVGSPLQMQSIQDTEYDSQAPSAQSVTTYGMIHLRRKGLAVLA